MLPVLHFNLDTLTLPILCCLLSTWRCIYVLLLVHISSADFCPFLPSSVLFLIHSFPTPYLFLPGFVLFLIYSFLMCPAPYVLLLSLFLFFIHSSPGLFCSSFSLLFLIYSFPGFVMFLNHSFSDVSCSLSIPSELCSVPYPFFSCRALLFKFLPVFFCSFFIPFQIYSLRYSFFLAVSCTLTISSMFCSVSHSLSACFALLLTHVFFIATCSLSTHSLLHSVPSLHPFPAVSCSCCPFTVAFPESHFW